MTGTGSLVNGASQANLLLFQAVLQLGEGCTHGTGVGGSSLGGSCSGGGCGRGFWAGGRGKRSVRDGW